ncbi:hypothetical protein FHS39_003806 [Streptomyces olivoverticillatus]|uniref:Uncharacterized protein n=1 Tax=Streptomyces olivoverticillatus TaxID=66427 RepID=A0A7W7LS13_9ACTN|nr:DUF6415 family natural product biosynthesis protein [Streptomyces olivoverticillatus]MBB4894748.1 hypothetical protein [Streptomyces olivoverticillatus]
MSQAKSGPEAGHTVAEVSQYLAEVIGRGLASPVALPRAEEVTEVTERLRGFLVRLVSEAEEHIGGMDRGTPQWYLAQTAVDAARRELGAGPGPGLRSAVLHMQNLGRACHHLRGVLLEGTNT